MKRNLKLPFLVLRLQARALRRYGIPARRFLKLTPAEFNLIEDDALQELKAADTREDIRAARIIAAVYNNNPNKKRSKTYSEKDFLPKAVFEKPKGESAGNLLAKTKWIHISLLSRAKAGK